MRLVVSIVLCLLLLGCAQKYKDVNSVSSVQLHDTSISGLDVYAKRRAKGESVPEFRGDQIIEVRAFSDNSNSQNEIEGANCHVEGVGYSKTVTTPAKVRLPIYGDQSSQIIVKCSHAGYHKKQIELASFNVNHQQRLNTASGGGLAGVVFMAVVNAASDTSKDIYLYPKALVVLEAINKE